MEYILSYLPYLLEGLWLSVRLWFVTIIFAVPLAMAFAVGRVSGHWIIKRLVGFHTWFWRGTPLMLQLFFMYYAMPFIGFMPSPFVAAAITFILNASAYHTEIFRAGIESIEMGQYEASKVLGMGYWQTMLRIVIPQAIKNSIPAACNEAIIVFKDTALVAAVAMGDLLRSAQEIVNSDFKISPFITVFFIYLIISWLVIRLFRTFEKKLSVMN